MRQSRSSYRAKLGAAVKIRSLGHRLRDTKFEWMMSLNAVQEGVRTRALEDRRLLGDEMESSPDSDPASVAETDGVVCAALLWNRPPVRAVDLEAFGGFPYLS